MTLTLFSMAFLLLVSMCSSSGLSLKEDWVNEDWEDDYFEEEEVTPRAEALMEVEVLDEEEEIGPSLGRVLGKYLYFHWTIYNINICQELDQ